MQTAIQNFQQTSGLLVGYSPDQVVAGLRNVTPEVFASLTPEAQQQAREIYRLAGIPVPGSPCTPQAGTTPSSGTGPATLDLDGLMRRYLTEQETTAGQIKGMLDGDIGEAARGRTRMEANRRGMVNSSMASAAGEAAALDAVTRIASEDAAAQRGAGDYNVALRNQAQLRNTEMFNEFLLKEMGINAEAAQQGRSIAAQLDIARLQDSTNRWQAQLQDATSRANTDTNYRAEQDRTRLQLANNIMMAQDMPPARRAALLRAMGPEYAGLADAIYVVTDVAEDLNG